MKSLVGFAIVVVVVMTAASVAPAASKQRRVTSVQTIRHLRQEVLSLKARLQRVTVERNKARAALARARTRPLKQAIADVRREAAWAQGGAISHLSGEYVAEAAMDYVIGHVRSGKYGYLEDIGAPLPPYLEPVNEVLATQTGICGQAERTFAAIVHALGFRVHAIGFEYVDPNGTPDSHAAAEVYYDGAWHFFDPTFGQLWTDAAGNVLSIADIRADHGRRLKDNAAFVNLIENASWGGDYTWFETDPSTVVITRRQPR